MRDLIDTIDRLFADNLPGWCTPQKAYALASLVIGTRPEVIVEIGVFGGRSFLPMALALKEIGKGMAIGIDPWSAAASVEGQMHPEDVKYWGQMIDHEEVYKRFTSEVFKLGLNNMTRVMRLRSDQAPVPPMINILHIDGNHGEQANADARRFAPVVVVGGYAILDDIGWTGGGPQRAADFCQEIGFKRMYDLDSGAVFQRIRA